MLINLENVSKKFGAKTLFKDINFNATYAFTIGNNPGSDTETKDVDGLTKGNRAYFSLTKNY